MTNKAMSKGDRKKAQQTAVKILKNAPVDLQKAWVQNDIQYFMDGNIGLALKDHLLLPCQEQHPFDLQKVMTDHYMKNQIYLSLPTQAVLLEHIKTQKEEGHKPQLWDFGEWLPCVDAQKLYDVLAILPNAIVTCSNPFTGLYFEADNGDGLLMPYRKPVVRQEEEEED